MSDEKAENKPPEKTMDSKPRETSQVSQPPEKPAEVKRVELTETFANKAGDQGVSFNPAVGINTPDPFVSQDVTPSQPPPTQTIALTPPSTQPTPPTSSIPSGNDTDPGE